MHIWLTIPSLSKRGGGPAAVVQSLSENMAALGLSVNVLTIEVEPGQSEALPRNQAVNVVHIPRNGRGSLSATFGGHLQDAIGEKLESRNAGSVVHDFGLWLPANHAVASVCGRLAIKHMCSTCGMLAPWAMRHKAWKKRLAWWLYQRRDLCRSALLVATSQQEVRDIRSLVPGKNIALVPNGVELPEVFGQRSEVRGETSDARGQRTAVFLGRIHAVKGLKNLLKAWNIVRPNGWRCIIAGPDEAGHQKELEAALRSFNLEDKFEFPGMMDNAQKWTLLRKADLFVLPSFTENFGISAAEAMAFGLPVITTKGTPWEEMIARKCGWWVDIGVEPLAAALREATALSDQERYEMGKRGYRLVEEKYSWPQIGRDMLAVYQWVLGQGPKPRCDVRT